MENLKKKTEGFTIIEVMIVLVIAAVIILIVFLAVPALQRNSRNNQRKNDVARVSAAVSEFASNNSGTLPANYGLLTTYVGSLAFYTLPSGSIDAATASQTVANANTIAIATNATCQTSGANIGKAATGGTARQFVVLYMVETGGTAAPQCVAG